MPKFIIERFLYELNQGKDLFFVSTKEEVIQKLTGYNNYSVQIPVKFRKVIQ